MAIDKKAIEEHIRGILVALGDNPDREGLKDTPARVARMYEEMFEGMNYSNHEIAEMFNKTFKEDLDENTDGNDMVYVKDIEIFSHCEHHIALMYDMKVSVGYIPQNFVLGLSKIVRLVDMVCKRLQLQEKIAEDIIDIMRILTKSDSIAVHIEAKHSCVTARGIHNVSSKTVTTNMGGEFLKSETLKLSFLENLKS